MCFGSSPLDPMSINRACSGDVILQGYSGSLREGRRRVCVWTLQPSDRRSRSGVWQNNYRAILSRAVADFAVHGRDGADARRVVSTWCCGLRW